MNTKNIASPARSKVRHVQRKCARLARAQGGKVKLSQALILGLAIASATGKIEGGFSAKRQLARRYAAEGR